MNSFQSLLESYSALRKRTYKIESLNLLLSETTAQDDNTLKATGMLGKVGVSKDDYNRFQLQFNKIKHTKDSPDNQIFIGAFGSPQPYVEGGYPPPSVWLNEDGSNVNFKGRSSDNVGSLPERDGPKIIEYLKYIQTRTGEGQGNIDAEAAEGQLTDVNGNPLDPEALARAQEVSAKNYEISNLAGDMQESGMFPNEATANVNALLAPTRVYPPGHPYEKLNSITSKLMEMFFSIGVPNPERIHEAVIELQKDTIDMLTWLKDNQQALDEALEKGGCIPEDDTIKKLRNRFYFANTNGSTFALGYGNFQGEDTNPSKMSGMVEGITDEDLEKFPNRDARGSGYKQVKEHQGNQSGTVSLSNSLGGVENHGNYNPKTGKDAQSTNPLAQMLSKYEKIKICNKDGSSSTENLFKKDHIESAGNLVSAISENSAVIASHLLHAKNLRAQGRIDEAEELEAKIGEVVKYLIEACEKYKEGVKELSKHVKAIEELNGGPMPFKTMAYQSVEDDIEGKVGNHFGENKKCKEVTLQILQRELEDNPIHNAVREMHEDLNNNFKGEVTVTMTHPDGRPVNKITGNQPPRQGVHDVPYHTRCVADSLLQCDNPEDMEYMLMKLGVKKGSSDWNLAMSPQGIKDNEKYIFPVSDKYYRKVGPTNQGVSDMSVLEKEDFVDQALLENLEGVRDIGEREALSKAGKKSIDNYNEDAREALLQLDDPDLLKGIDNPRGKELNTQGDIEQNTLRADIESTLINGDVNISSESYDEADSILNELKDLNKLKDSGDPTYASKTRVLSYRIAEFKQQRRIDRLAKFDKLTPKQKKEINELKAGREIRKAIALTGTGPGVIVVKNSDARGTHLVTHGQVRNAAAAKSLSYLRDDENFRKETELDKQTNAGDRIKTNRDTGNQSKKMSGNIHALKILQQSKEVSNYI